MEIKEGKLICRVMLEGKRFRVFEDALIDTGAAFTVIPPEVSDFLELETDKNLPKIKLITASGLIEVPVKILERIRVEEVKVRKLQVVVHKIPDLAPIKILLGMNFLEKVKLEINRKENKFNLKDP